MPAVRGLASTQLHRRKGEPDPFVNGTTSVGQTTSVDTDLDQWCRGAGHDDSIHHELAVHFRIRLRPDDTCDRGWLSASGSDGLLGTGTDMTDLGIADRVEKYLELIGVDRQARWLNPPATKAEIAATEEALGYEVPEDLKEVLSRHNGGSIFDAYEWIGCFVDDRKGLSWFRDFLRGVLNEIRGYATLDPEPGRRTLYVATIGQVGILYDPDSSGHQILLLDVVAGRQVTPLAADLSALVDYYLALAEAGLVETGTNWPHQAGSSEDRREIRLAHGVRPDGW